MEALKPTRHLFLILFFFNTINVLCEKDIEETPAEIWQSQHLTLKHQKELLFQTRLGSWFAQIYM